jgi:Ca2+-binding RTX toxin-like protein
MKRISGRMPITKYDSIRICIEIALVLIATILFQIFMPLLVWGDKLDCVEDKLCHGIEKANIMIDDNISNIMRGLDEADQRIGGERHDTIFGGDGGDTVIGGLANDVIVSDQISAESGDDRIYQRSINSTEPDGSKDVINFRDGKDEIWINFSIDGDQVSDDYEIIHKG